MWKLYEIKISASINKVLLGHGHTYSFCVILCIAYGCFHIAELSGCDKKPYDPGSFYYLALQRGSLPISALGQVLDYFLKNDSDHK